MFLQSMICLVTVRAATNSEPFLAVSTVPCCFDYQSIGMILMKCNTAVTDFPVTMSCSKLASRIVEDITQFPSGLGMSFANTCLTFP